MMVYVPVKRNEGIMKENVLKTFGGVEEPFNTLNCVHYMYTCTMDEVRSIIDLNDALNKLVGTIFCF